MVWGFGAATIATNLARDLGCRIVAAIFFGGDAFDRYSPIGIFTNVPATFFAVAVYELIMRDSFASIAKGHNVSDFPIPRRGQFFNNRSFSRSSWLSIFME